MKPLRVLYLWNTAGALTPVADWLLDHGHQARILMSTEYDLFGSTSCSDAALMVDSVISYYLEVLRHLLVFQPTHVHINANIPSLILARLLKPTTPIVFQYHGIEVRYRDRVHPEMALADRVIVSTPDLRDYGRWYDRPVSKMFYYRGGREPNTAVMFYADYFMEDLRREAKQWCEERNIDLRIIQRGLDPIIPYAEMPQFLSKFEYFMDFKGYGDPEAISRLALEAIACGCKIVSDTDPTHVIDDYDLPKPEVYYELYTDMKRPPLSINRQVIALRGLMKWGLGSLAPIPRPPPQRQSSNFQERI